MADSFHWLDVDRIAEDLADAHPETDPYSVNFPRLRTLVEALPGFAAQPGHPVNERILEEIQRLWKEELDDLPRDDDED